MLSITISPCPFSPSSLLLSHPISLLLPCLIFSITTHLSSISPLSCASFPPLYYFAFSPNLPFPPYLSLLLVLYQLLVLSVCVAIFNITDYDNDRNVY